MTVVIGCGAGFSGDRTDAAAPVVEALARYDAPRALMFETLGERTLADAQLRRVEDAETGYEPLLEQYLRPILGECLAQKIPVLGNFGAANPPAAGRRIAALAAEAGWPAASIAVVTGDDLRERLEELSLTPWEGERGELPALERIVAANVYIGSAALVEALSRGAAVVAVGRIADPALALGPLVYHHGWAWDDWDRLAAGTVAGHLIECGAQVTGGYFADPGLKDVPRLDALGFPIVEVEADGRIVVTKPAGTGGCVTERTVKEQLLYEVHDPAAYLTPDVTVDFSRVEVRQIGPDRVAVTGVRGKPAPPTLKTTVSYLDGYLGEAEISYGGPNAQRRAQLAAETLRQRLQARIPADLRRRLDLIGCVSTFDGDGGGLQEAASLDDAADGDVRLRLAVAHAERHWVELATQELLALYCCGPAGGGGVRRHHKRRLRTASFLISRQEVRPRVALLGEGQR
jgi:hypothetical protein